MGSESECSRCGEMCYGNWIDIDGDDYFFCRDCKSYAVGELFENYTRCFYCLKNTYKEHNYSECRERLLNKFPNFDHTNAKQYFRSDKVTSKYDIEAFIGLLTGGNIISKYRGFKKFTHGPSVTHYNYLKDMSGQDLGYINKKFVESFMDKARIRKNGARILVLLNATLIEEMKTRNRYFFTVLLCINKLIKGYFPRLLVEKIMDELALSKDFSSFMDYCKFQRFRWC